MEAKTEGVMASIISQGEKLGIEKGFEKGERKVIQELLNKYSIDEISDMLDRKPSDIHRIIYGD